MLIHFDPPIRWRGYRDPDTGFWVGVCDELSLTAEADTFPELYTLSFEIVSDFLHTLWRDGRLEAFLADKGWTASDPIPLPPAEIDFAVAMEYRSAA